VKMPTANPTSACVQTVAAAMGVALRECRLFDETQRPGQGRAGARGRTADHQQHQQGLAAELDFQAIVDLVGISLRAVFNIPVLIHKLVR